MAGPQVEPARGPPRRGPAIDPGPLPTDPEAAPRPCPRGPQGRPRPLSGPPRGVARQALTKYGLSDFSNQRSGMGEVGFEPTRPKGQQGLSLPCLPFHHNP